MPDTTFSARTPGAFDDPEGQAELLVLLTRSIHPDLATAIGHAMRFAHEDNSGDPLFLSERLQDAAEAFYDTSVVLSERLPNG